MLYEVGNMKKTASRKTQFSHNLVHVAVVVRDMEKAVKRFEALGIGPFELAQAPPSTCSMCFRGKPLKSDQKEFKVNLGNIILELWQPVSGESPWQEFLDNKGEGIHHLAFDVDDIDKQAKEYIKQGASLVLSGRTPDGKGGVYLDLGVGNMIIELEDIT
jgi:methylmalonyl-CoA/ethylmalonyl-CoA epimerase